MMKVLAMMMVSAAVGGCMTFNEAMLRPAPISPPARAVAVEVRVGDFAQTRNGEGKNEGLTSNATLANQLNKLIMRRWESKGVVSQYGAPGDLKVQADYAFTLSGRRDEDSSFMGAFFSGLTLMLIPSTSSLTFDLQGDLEDLRTGRHYQAKAKNATTTVMELLFLPALPVFWLGSQHTHEDIADALYGQFQAQGAFK